MTHLIERNGHYVAGETVVWEFTIERNGSTKDLTGATVEWHLVPSKGDPNSDSLLDHTSSGVTSEVSDASNAVVTVEIESGTTDDMGGKEYWQRLIVIEDDGTKDIWNGNFPIREC